MCIRETEFSSLLQPCPSLRSARLVLPVKGSVPAATVPRLALYLRKVRELRAQGRERVSSQELAELVDLNPAQIRKDLSYFGEFGVRGVGYEVARLAGEIERCLGLSRTWNMIIVGAGQLGTALAWYRGFTQQGFRLAGVFDSSPKKIGGSIGLGQVMAVAGLEQFCRQRDASDERVDIALVAVPAEAAQVTVDRLVAAGIRAILSFAPVRVSVPPEVLVRQVDLSSELMHLSFFLSHEHTPS
jgi:redox-sensing transcriptional repressor